MAQYQDLEILYEDEFLLAIDKPAGLLVHPTNLDFHEKNSALRLVESQTGLKLAPVHRLDKATSGILLFSKDPLNYKKLHGLFAEKDTLKSYLAICRGYTPEEGIIDYPLRHPEYRQKERKEAITHFKRLSTAEIQTAVGRYNSSRYSLVEIYPKTGRSHQIRMHFAHLRHYIIGDKKHGDRHHNKAFREIHKIDRMFLHLQKLLFQHPMTGEKVEINCDRDEQWNRAFELLSW
jgi:tRNA pseudouridine65 synthase